MQAKVTAQNIACVLDLPRQITPRIISPKEERTMLGFPSTVGVMSTLASNRNVPSLNSLAGEAVDAWATSFERTK